MISNSEIKQIIGKLEEKGVSHVGGLIEFVKDQENYKQFSEKELQFLNDLKKICEKIEKKFHEKFENIYSSAFL